MKKKLILIIAGVALLVVVLKNVQSNGTSYRTVSTSMLPNERMNEKLSVDPSFDKASLQRGDIVIVQMMEDENSIFPKRVVGLPGDQIRIEDGKIVLNNQMVAQTLSSESESVIRSLSKEELSRMNLPQEESLSVYEENLGGKSYNILHNKTSQKENFGSVTVPSDAIFVMGDNRGYSSDSRILGSVKFARIKGRVKN